MSEPINIPYIAHEAAMSRLERSNRRLWIVVLVLIVMLVGSNIAWLIYEAQYEDFEATITQDAQNESGDIILNGTGEISIDGQSEPDDNN